MPMIRTRSPVERSTVSPSTTWVTVTVGMAAGRATGFGAVGAEVVAGAPGVVTASTAGASVVFAAASVVGTAAVESGAAVDEVGSVTSVLVAGSIEAAVGGS